ncbi:MAG TPA: nicotinamide-nucleotide adenylyltransferase [Thermoplasmata archaeon]|nr:nicotinamide-nucleotide adenylyltransferase [Thermoplasmata archaeon]
MCPAVRGLLVGRFQPFHAGHLGTVRAIRTEHPREELVLAIGSAEESYTYENPFTASERYEMIARALVADGIDGVIPVPVADIRRHALWVRYLEGLLPKFETVYTNNPLTRLLFERAGYAVVSPPLLDRRRFEGRRIRALLASGRPPGDRLPAAVAKYLAEIDARGRLRLLRGRRPVEGARGP